MVMGLKSPPVVAERDLGMKTLGHLEVLGKHSEGQPVGENDGKNGWWNLETSFRVRPSGPGAVFASVFLSTLWSSPSVNGSTSTLSTCSDVMNPSTGLDGVDMRRS